MHFIKYPSLINFYSIAKNRDVVDCLDKEYYATEKIHGSNIQVCITDKKEVLVGKRSAYITDEKPYSIVYEMLTDEFIESIYEYIKNNNLKRVIIYGELFGSGIQRMDYDLNKENKKGIRFFDFFEVEQDNAIYSNLKSFQTLVPEDMRTPIIKVDLLKNLINDELKKESYYGGSMSEGNVYKPYVDRYCLCKSGTDKRYYPVVKHKHKDFSEVKNVSQKEVIILSEDEIAAIDLVDNYNTKNRVKNVLSKGDVELIDKNIGIIIKKTQEDIFKELTAENENIDEELIKKTINKTTAKEIVKFIKEIMKETSNEHCK